MSKRRDAQRYRKSYSYFRPAPRLNVEDDDSAYVDKNTAWSIDWKQSVRAASTPGLNVSLTGGPYTVDGITLADGDRVLLKDQTDPSENGIYVYNASSLLLVRDYDALQGTLSSGAACFVEKGTSNSESMWVLSTHDPITVGTTNLVWDEFFPFGHLSSSIFTETGPVYAKTTSSVSFDSSFRNPNQIGSDVFFFVSGSLDGAGKSVFGGNVTTSGSIDSSMGLSGSLTTLSDGSSYLIAGPGISIVSQSNGPVTISFISPPAPTMVWNEKIGIGDGIITSFSLAYVPSVATALMIFANGVLQEQDSSFADFQITGSVVTFTAPPDTGTKIIATYYRA